MPSYSSAEKSHIIDAAGRGVPWDEIGASLSPPRSSEAVQLAARRMRKRGEWPTNEGAVRLTPEGPGRPRNRTRTVPVSVRLAPEVDMALRIVAESAGVRVGKVVDEAVKRAVQRLQDEQAELAPPFGLDPGSMVKISAGNKSQTCSVCVDEMSLAALRKRAAPKGKRKRLACRSDVIHAAIVRLLQDLNFKVSAGV